jgi:hypothetical protein
MPYLISCFSDFYVWFRSDSEPEIKEIPYHDDTEYKLLTVDALKAATKGAQITHMAIDGNIPPNLQTITPHLKQLRLRGIPDSDQLKR